jgi:hypothetical protein
MGECRKAREHYEIVMSGKGLELSPKKTKGKVSLQVSEPLHRLRALGMSSLMLCV